MSLSLLPSDSSEEDEPGPSSGFKINEAYAKSHTRFREKEEFQRLKAKYGEDVARKKLDDAAEDSDDSDDSSSSDEDGSRWTDEMDRRLIQTLACLKKRDARIYDKEADFWDKPVAASSSGKSVTKKEKPLYIGDLERKVMVEKSGRFDDMEDDELAQKSRGKTYREEQDELRRNLQVKVEEEDSDDDGGGLFKKKVKSKEERDREEEDYKNWEKELNLQRGSDDDEEKANERFVLKHVMNYNKPGGALDDSDDDDKEEEDGIKRVHDSDDGLSEDERTLAQAAEFEHKYNHRFEEPNAEFIQRYPRTTEDSLRRKDNKRARKRAETRDRKEVEKRKREEELKRLKTLKGKELMAKMEQVLKEAGTREIDINEDDLEGDFDPEEHDRRMAQMFSNYDEVEVENEEERPEFSDLGSDIDDMQENWDGWEGRERQGDKGNQGDDDNEEEEAEGQYRGEDIDMDCELDPEADRRAAQQELIDSTRGKKRKRKSKFAQVMEQKKPVFDPKNHKDFQKYLDEYYKLDYEDLIAGKLRCRFKYREVVANDFGLSTGDVLSAPDAQLNAWCSLKKTCQYRTDEEERADVNVFSRKGKNEGLKKKILPALFTENPEEELQAEQDRKSAKSKKRKREENEDDEVDSGRKEVKKMEEDENEVEPATKKSKKKKKKKKKKIAATEAGPSQEKPSSSTNGWGSSPKKKGKKKKGEAAAAAMTKKGKMDLGGNIHMATGRMGAFMQKENQLKRKARKQKFRTSQ